MSIFHNRAIIVGVTGGIACYKAAELVREFMKAGATVDVVMTAEAAKFVTPLTFGSLSRRPVLLDIWEQRGGVAAPHIEVATRGELLVVAPATAHSIARLAHGMADDMVSLVALASPSPLVVAPAMETHMYQSAAVRENLATLRRRGAVIVEPEWGELASGAMGQGRLAPLESIVAACRQALARNGDLAGRTVVISAGGTREPLDPVRYLGNRSSGKMGFALAEAALDRGARVVLIQGAVSARPPVGVELVEVERAEEMRDAVLRYLPEASVLIMAAAVADYRPADIAADKIKKSADDMTIKLERTPDILGETAGKFPHVVRVGFAAETRDLLAYAGDKLARKQLDFIVANDVTSPGSGFGTETNQVTLLFADGRQEALPLLSKAEVAERVLAATVEIMKAKL